MPVSYLAICASAFVVGLPVGIPIGLVQRAAVRAPLLIAGLLGPVVGLSLWVFHVVNDDLDPLFWAVTILLAYALPLLSWCAAVGGGYALATKYRLDRQAARGGMIG